MRTEHREIDVEAQLRAFAVALEAQMAEPIRPSLRTFDNAPRDLVVVEPTLMPARPDRRQWLLPAIAAVVALVIGGLVLISRSDDSGPVVIDEGPDPSVDEQPEPTVDDESRADEGSTGENQDGREQTPGTVDDDTGPVVTEVGEWTRIDGLGAHIEVFGDGQSFFGVRQGDVGVELLRSDDGRRWDVVDVSNLADPVLAEFHSRNLFLGHAAVRDGRLVAVEERGTSLTVHIIEPDGTVSSEDVSFAIPAPYQPFHHELNSIVNILHDGTIVISASYYADPGAVNVTGATRDELGLDLLYSIPRPLVALSADGSTWTQHEVSSDRFVGPVLTADDRLVALTGPIAFELPDLVPSVSVDGVTWEPLVDPGTGGELPQGDHRLSASGDGSFMSNQNHTFYLASGRIWRITADGPVLIADSSLNSELLEIFETRHIGALTVGDAGIAYLSAYDESPQRAGSGIHYSVDNGRSWSFLPLPDGLDDASHVAVGSSSLVLSSIESGARTLWVRELAD